MQLFRLPTPRVLKTFKIAGILLLTWLVVAGILLAAKWPFTVAKTIARLEHFSDSRVRIGRFRPIFMPIPGYVLEDVVFERNSPSGAVKLAVVRQFICRASWPAMLSFRHHATQIRVEGLQVFIPVRLPPPMRTEAPSRINTTRVEELIADGTVLKIAPRDGNGSPLRFVFHRLRLGNIASHSAVTFETLLENPEPSGELAVNGRFGPLDPKRVEECPVSGSFRLTRADLSHYQGIGGQLSGVGSFNGILRQVTINGRSDIADFEVAKSGHKVQLSSAFELAVDGLNGDTKVKKASAHFLHSTVAASGEICSMAGQPGKTATLDLTTNNARVEDLLRIFVTSNQPAVQGPIAFRAHAELPPDSRPFIRRLSLQGDFDIRPAFFSKPDTSHKVDELSRHARGLKEQQTTAVASELRSRADLREGIAYLSNSTFGIPGAKATGGGTYGLRAKDIHLAGTLAMQSSLSKAAGGAKSVLLMPLNPFFKKPDAGAVIAFQITGNYPHPEFHLMLRKPKPGARYRRRERG